MQYVFYISIILLAVIGISDLICYIEQCFYRQKRKVRVVILPLKGRVENIEHIIKKIVSKEKFSRSTQVQLYIIDQGLSDETVAIINLLCKNYSYIFLCNENNLEEKIHQNLNLL